MYEDIAILKGEPVATYDSYGNENISYTDTTVMVRSRSVYQSEFYNVAQLGLQPTLALIINNRADYQGQKLVEYRGVLYDIIRADWSNGRDTITLTLTEREHE